MKRLLCALLVVFSFNSIVCAINNIMIEAYSQALVENYRDVESLLGRAKEYYNRDDMFKALADVNKAIQYTESDDKQMLQEEHLLRANIYNNLERFDKALEDLNLVLKGVYDPYALELRADLFLKMGNWAKAKADYQSLLNMNGRNYNAMYGLAMVAVKQQNNGIALEYVDRAVSLYPKNPVVYLNRSDVLTEMGELSRAAHDLIFAMSLDYANARVARTLLAMSRSNYNVVIESLNDAISRAKGGLELYYVRAFIKMSNTDYMGALEDMVKVISNIEDKYSDGVNSDLSTILFKLGRFEDAQGFADMAVRLNPNKILYYIQKAMAEREIGNIAAAEASIKLALMINPISSDALVLMSFVKMDAGDYNEALRYINDAIMNNPEVAENLILRAVIRGNYLNDEAGANSDLNIVLALDDSGLDSYRGFALALLGDNKGAVSWIEEQLKVADDLCEVNYRAAVLFSMVGDMDRAMACVEVALANGYGDYYNLMINKSGFMNCSLLRNLSSYKVLVDRYLGVK